MRTPPPVEALLEPCIEAIVGSKNAKVFPLPVCAAQSTSLPAMMRGIACFWIGVGFLCRILVRFPDRNDGSELCSSSKLSSDGTSFAFGPDRTTVMLSYWSKLMPLPAEASVPNTSANGKCANFGLMHLHVYTQYCEAARSAQVQCGLPSEGGNFLACLLPAAAAAQLKKNSASASAFLSIACTWARRRDTLRSSFALTGGRFSSMTKSRMNIMNI